MQTVSSAGVSSQLAVFASLSRVVGPRLGRSIFRPTLNLRPCCLSWAHRSGSQVKDIANDDSTGDNGSLGWNLDEVLRFLDE